MAYLGDVGIRSAMQAFQAPAAAASTYMLVPKSFLMRAAGLNHLQSMTVVIAAPLGPCYKCHANRLGPIYRCVHCTVL